MKPAVAFALLGLTAAACAPAAELNANVASAPQGSPRQCFDTDRISNFTSGERNGTLYVRSRGANGGVFEISGPGCWELDNVVQLGLRAPGLIGTRACEGDSVQIITPQGGGGRPDVCRAYVVRALTEAEVEALPPRSRPS